MRGLRDENSICPEKCHLDHIQNDQLAAFIDINIIICVISENRARQLKIITTKRIVRFRGSKEVETSLVEGCTLKNFHLSKFKMTIGHYLL